MALVGSVVSLQGGEQAVDGQNDGGQSGEHGPGVKRVIAVVLSDEAVEPAEHRLAERLIVFCPVAQYLHQVCRHVCLLHLQLQSKHCQ